MELYGALSCSTQGKGRLIILAVYTHIFKLTSKGLIIAKSSKRHHFHILLYVKHF